MKPFWVSWYAHLDVSFTWHGPWWRSGWRVVVHKGEEREQSTLCAAVMAESEEHALQLIVAAHDEPVEIEWRFANERAAGWDPRGGEGSRFRGKEWMQWPWPAALLACSKLVEPDSSVCGKPAVRRHVRSGGICADCVAHLLAAGWSADEIDRQYPRLEPEAAALTDAEASP